MGDYAINFDGRTFTPNQTPVNAAEIEQHNAKVEADELASWASAPDCFAVYICGRDATTWQGVKLNAAPVSLSTFRGNIAREMTSVRFRGTNGATYYGRFGSEWSQLCRVRKAK